MLMNMKELLAVANKNNFAVPAFNISDYNMFNGIMEASEEKMLCHYRDPSGRTEPYNNGNGKRYY